MSKELNKKKKNAFVKMCVFMAVITLPMLTWGILKGVSVFEPSVMTKLDYDLGENRKKSKFPTSFNAKTITAELEAYYNDRVPFRSIIIKVNREIYGTIEKPYDNTLGPFLVGLFYDSENSQGSISTPDMDLDDLFGDETESTDGSGDNETPETPTKCEHKYTVIESREPDYEWYGYTLYSCSLCGHETKSDFKDKLVDISYMPPKLHNGITVEGRMKWLFYNAEDNLEYYKGTNILDEATMAEWLDKMEELQAICDEKDIQLLYMIMPSKEQVYSEYMPTYVVADSYKRVPRFVDYVKDNSDVNFIYPIEELLVAKKYWQVYYKYDTHWNNVGGFIGTQSVLSALGKNTTNLANLSVTEYQPAAGDLVNLGNLEASLYGDDREYQIEYKSEISNLLAEGKEDEIYHVKTNSQNTEKLVVVGDSFRIHLSKFLCKEFEESTITHRNFLDNELVQESIRNADVLVVSANERYDLNMIESIDTIINILEED